MQNTPKTTAPSTPLSRLIGQLPAQSAVAGVPDLWRRLNMEAVARRVIQTARMAAAEQTLQRAEETIRRRDEAAAQAALARPATA